MDFKGLRILVTDGSGRQIPTVLEQLHELGCVTVTVNSSRLDCGYTSRYPERRILCPRAERDPDALKEVLDREILSGSFDAVFPMLEMSTSVCLENEKEYRKHVKIIAAPAEAFRIAADKQKTMMACMENGIPCPVTRRDGEEAEEFIRRTGYPIAVKPREGTGSIGFHCVKNAGQMEMLHAQGFKEEKNVIQEYIPQTDIQYIGIFMTDAEGELRSAVICGKYRWYPVDGGAACYLRTVDRPDLVDCGYRLLKAIGWRGEAHLDFIADPRDGSRAKVLEINGRIPASIKICKCAGIPLIRQELQYAFGESVEDCTGKKVSEGIALRYFQTDLLWLLRSPGRFRAKPSWFDFSGSSDFIFSIRDPLPFFSYSLSHLLSYREDMKKRAR